MGQSNHHERPEDIGRPVVPTAEQVEHDPFSFENRCRIVREHDRLLHLRKRRQEELQSYAWVDEATGEEAEDALHSG